MYLNPSYDPCQFKNAQPRNFISILRTSGFIYTKYCSVNHVEQWTKRSWLYLLECHSTKDSYNFLACFSPKWVVHFSKICSTSFVDKINFMLFEQKYSCTHFCCRIQWLDLLYWCKVRCSDSQNSWFYTYTDLWINQSIVMRWSTSCYALMV